MAGTAKTRRPWQPEIVRKRIQISMLLNRLRDHALGNCEMSATQVRSAEILLKKALPDLQSVEYTGDISVTDARDLSKEILERIAAGSSAGTAEADGCSGEPAELH